MSMCDLRGYVHNQRIGEPGIPAAAQPIRRQSRAGSEGCGSRAEPSSPSPSHSPGAPERSQGKGAYPMKRAFQSRGKRGLRLASRALDSLVFARGAGTAKRQGGHIQRKGHLSCEGSGSRAGPSSPSPSALTGAPERPKGKGDISKEKGHLRRAGS